MKIDTTNWEDCKKYYQNCWIKVKECGERIYQVTEVRPDFTYLKSPKRGDGDEFDNIRIDMSIGYTIEYVIPKKTIYQYGEHALSLERIPARMWKKGMDTKNTQFNVLMADGKWSRTDCSIPVIEGFINKPSYFTVDEALNNFNLETLQSAALTNRVSLTKQGGVFIDSILVGKYYKDTKILTYKAIYKNDLEPLFNNTKFKAV